MTDEPVWPGFGTIRGKGDKISRDVSGIACIEDEGWPRYGLLVDDERRSAQIVVVQEGQLTGGDSIKLIDGDLSLDGEGVAYWKDAFYVIGSHGYPRDPQRKLNPKDDGELIERAIDASSHLFQIPLKRRQIDKDGRLKRPLDEKREFDFRTVLRSFPVLRPYVDRRLDDNGLTVEGLAVRDGRLHVGLRGPILTGAEIDRPEDADTQFAGLITAGIAEPLAEPKLDWLPLGAGRGIRDLARLKKGLLILAGPSHSMPSEIPVADGSYALYLRSWSGKSMRKLGPIKGGFTEGGEAIKPEAILPLDISGGRLRVLVFFDHAVEGGARPMVFDLS